MRTEDTKHLQEEPAAKSTAETRSQFTIVADREEEEFAEAVDQMLDGKLTLQSAYEKIPEHDLRLSLLPRLLYRIHPAIYLK